MNSVRPPHAVLRFTFTFLEDISAQCILKLGTGLFDFKRFHFHSFLIVKSLPQTPGNICQKRHKLGKHKDIQGLVKISHWMKKVRRYHPSRNVTKLLTSSKAPRVAKHTILQNQASFGEDFCNLCKIFMKKLFKSDTLVNNDFP